VDIIVTDLALLRRPSRDPAARFVLSEIAAGFTVEEVLAVTGMSVDVAGEVGVMQQNWI
jgi:3-oxoacid CoA-transferase